ncbi:glycosyltransferase family 2 protein [Rhizobium lentis]|uniref:Glycosyltransferase n=1 Tax=Rhizobium lentis TaxID=1138194 RepID=A0ABS7IS54_9HYPH|nr:glycosyltransferase [Rhizobium lentis]MBX4959556.1 glycosyltransferase [Rhizobium lentis]MBX4973292.1 glycosyltransferase [Rhizobium lentis]MBX4989688.1 glycosyltransferase [Rhizobium lentis]MBX5008005.1 glycosyltransferase [Rhizobium lentis]MBX5032641.1 glycosyltransferase [Rhizobium lentis]
MRVPIPSDLKDINFPVPIHYLDFPSAGVDAVSPALSEGLVVFLSDGLPVGQAYVEGPERAAVLVERVVRRDTLDHARRVAETPLGNRDVSILICTKDRPEELRRCLASIPEQSLRPVEIIVVDNASAGDATRRVVEEAGATYVREDRVGLDYARNAAIRAAKTEFVAFTDDDVVLHERWLENLMKAFDQPEIACVTGLILPGELATPAQFIFEKHWGFGRGYLRQDFDHHFYNSHARYGAPVWTIGAGASQAFRRKVFDEIGLFDVRLDMGAAGCSGDSEYWNRLLHHGHVCRYEPTAVSWHFHRKDMKGLAKQIHQYMSGHIAALLVQYQNTGNGGNLRRILISFPKYFAGRLRKRLRKGVSSHDVFLKQEILGCVSGALYVLRRWKMPAW